MPEDPAHEEGQIERERVPFVYSNQARVRASGFDVVIDFGQLTPDVEADLAPAEVRIAMSWEHAKVLTRVLAETIKAFEANIASIPDVGDEGMEKLAEELEE